MYTFLARGSQTVCTDTGTTLLFPIAVVMKFFATESACVNSIFVPRVIGLVFGASLRAKAGARRKVGLVFLTTNRAYGFDGFSGLPHFQSVLRVPRQSLLRRVPRFCGLAGLFKALERTLSELGVGHLLKRVLAFMLRRVDHFKIA